jgi:hypothetical protein
MKYWIIDLEGYGMAEGTKEARGPFKSIADAEKWLKADAEENFRSLNEPGKLGEDREWAIPVLIVEEKKKLHQIPVVSVKINLEAAK